MEYTQEIYDGINNYLGLPKGAERIYWDIDDNIKGTQIYLLHYKSDKLKDIIHRPDYSPKLPNGTLLDKEDCDLILSLRGLILDMETKWICCKSFGYTNIVSLDNIDSEDVTMTDQFNNSSSYNTKDLTLQTFYSGPIIRVWKYKGTVYFSSHRKISINKVRWVVSQTFDIIFLELFNLSNKKKCANLSEIGNLMFSGDKQTANFCHMFLMSYPGLVHGTRANIGEGFLTYLNSIILNKFRSHEAFLHYKENKTIEENVTNNTWLKTQKFRNNIKISDIHPRISIKHEEGITVPSKINVDVANIILKCGYSGLNDHDVDLVDKRVQPGECVIAILPSGQYVKISPTCVNWRNYILSNNFNFYNQYCKNLDYANFESVEHELINKENYLLRLDSNKMKNYTYEDIFPELGYPTGEQLSEFNGDTPDTFEKPVIKKKTIVSKEEKEKEDDENIDLMIRNISYCYIFAVPHHMIQESKGFYNRFHDDLDNLNEYFKMNIKTLGMEIENETLVDNIKFSKSDNKGGRRLNTSGKAITNIINKATQYMEKVIENGKDYKYDKDTKKKVKMSPKEILLKSINYELIREFGTNLYALFKIMKDKEEE